MVKRQREKKTGKKNPYILPEFVKPRRYSIELEPEMSAGTCKGKETIFLDILKPVKEIKINVHEVTISKATLGQQTAKIRYDKELQTATLNFPTLIKKGKAELALTFESKIRDDLRGFYKSMYEVNGQKRVILTTQFEPADARRCFPCFDEPALKAKFQVTLIIPQELNAISNMPIKREIKEGNKKRIIFEETPLMSPHLLAFFVGEFEGIQEKTNKGTVVSIWTTPGKKHLGQFALDTAIKTLEYYESYFNIPYQLPKLDLLAIPDFESAAMENWGAITYRERVLLYDPKHSSAASKEQIAVVIAHELAHQWFGDLVTMQWWSDLWLNEGFASWMESKATNHLFPEWEMDIQFNTDRQAVAFSLDGLETSHPIEAEVVNPGEIYEIFDQVSYSKGAAIIHMLEQYLGEEIFRKGLQYYLNKFKHQNTVTQDLWDALAHVSGKPVKKIMDSWTKQTGYPLLTTKTTENKIQLTQERFFFSGRKKDATMWYIPVAITHEKEATYHLIGKKQQEIPRNKDVAIINKNQVGFYRIHYDNLLFQEQLKLLQEKKLGLLDKIGLITNVYALAEAKYTDITQFLDLLQHVRDETNYTLWSEIGGSIGQLQAMFNDMSFIDDIDLLCRWTFSNILKKIGWEEKKDEKHTDILLRALVLATTGFSKEELVQKEARKRFQEYLKTKTINQNLKGVIYSLAAWTGDAETWEQLKKLQQEAKLQEEQVRILAAMCMFQQKDLLQKTLEYSLSPVIRHQDSPVGAARVARNPFGRELAWKFFKENWDEYNKRYGAGGHIMEGLISAITAGFTTLEKKQEVKTFFDKHAVPHAKRAIQQALENIDLNYEFIKKYKITVASWLKSWKQQHKL
ncbi:M1 family metallopeptidase [Candidatus Woesearchaeota archaeon]|nr:M1 family metallopeptidase [Candidatus Woesearchaeota archaeon]